MIIREALPSDIAQIRDIYSYYVEETTVSFEYETPEPDEMENRRRSADEYLAAEENGRILGYAYAHLLSTREGYGRSREVSIYIRHGEERKGIGRALYDELEKRLKGRGIRNLYAIVSCPDSGSVGFHQRMGYKIAGKLTDCGEKHGKLLSVVYMEKMI